jgi:hypothetical protein
MNKLRYELLAVDPDSTDNDLSKSVVYTSDDISTIKEYIESNLISSNKILYLHDRQEDIITGITRKQK